MLQGYRDMLLNLDVEGVFCEVQIGLSALVAVRRRMHKFYGVVRSIGDERLIAMAKPLPEHLLRMVAPAMSGSGSAVGETNAVPPAQRRGSILSRAF